MVMVVNAATVRGNVSGYRKIMGKRGQSGTIHSYIENGCIRDRDGGCCDGGQGEGVEGESEGVGGES